MYLTDFSKILGVEEEGGKGHNLKRLVAFGFKVPVGFVVGASFYRDHYPEPPSFDYTDEARPEEQCLTMQETIITSPVDADMDGKILNFLAALGMKSHFAVRSSSTYEDLAEAAFAGQHETFLNVPVSDIWKKVTFCFASLWQKHAVLYRNHNHFNQKHTSMAVVIQQMIEPDVSGVAFSVDPVGGNLSHVLVEANYGLGESVVSGEAVTDSWIVDKKSGEIIERRIEKKEKRVVSDKSGGVKSVRIDTGFQDIPCLEDHQIKRIAQTVRKIEDCFGAPQDVE